MKMVLVLAPPLVHRIQINPKAKGEDSPPLLHPIQINLKGEDSRLYLFYGFRRNFFLKWKLKIFLF